MTPIKATFVRIRADGRVLGAVSTLGEPEETAVHFERIEHEGWVPTFYSKSIDHTRVAFSLPPCFEPREEDLVALERAFENERAAARPVGVEPDSPRDWPEP